MDQVTEIGLKQLGFVSVLLHGGTSGSLTCFLSDLSDKVKGTEHHQKEDSPGFS